MKIKKSKQLQVLAALAVVSFAVLTLLFITNALLESVPDYFDLNPLWTRSGEEFTYFRYYWNLRGKKDLLEFWKARHDGSRPLRLARFDKGFILYSIRFFRVAENGREVVLRLSREDREYPFRIRDYLFLINVATGEKRVWELDKKSQWDIFLAYDYDTALVRRVAGGGRNRLVFTDFGGTSIFSEFSYGADEVCAAAVLFDGGRSAFVALDNSALAPGNPGKYRTAIIHRDRSLKPSWAPVECRIISPYYLKKTGLFVAHGSDSPRVPGSKAFYVFDRSMKLLRTIPDPSDDRHFVFEYSCAPDEGTILHSQGRDVYRMDIRSGASKKVGFGFQIIPPVQEGPGHALLVTGKTGIFTSREAGDSLKRVTDLSPRRALEQHQWFRRYEDARETFSRSVLHLAYPDEFQEINKGEAHGEPPGEEESD
ncbi:MAG: hypothetical protein RDV48_13590 [Candidatus Eremiobacteraeota bacterium]|nr:hypothetical protein [Candidatus Eremiobacteraeota bacterium]